MSVGFPMSLVDPDNGAPYRAASDPPRLAPEKWANPSVTFDARVYSDVEVQVTGEPTTPYQPRRSLDGAAWVSVAAVDDAGTSYSTITAAGIYALPGYGFLQLSAGDGSTITRRAAA